MDSWTVEPLDKRGITKFEILSKLELWDVELLNCWTVELLDKRSATEFDILLKLEHWTVELLDCWTCWTVEPVGLLNPWTKGVPQNLTSS